ncbi:MAG: taurine catabolism dioxygenase, partial [Pseudomonadota bacterium]|nr:taurine catabolism dioxygenase [Pseudomonadota bacterium]
MQIASLEKSAMFSIRPLGATFAAEIAGLDLADAIGDEVFRPLYQTFIDHKVLVFRAQHFDD